MSDATPTNEAEAAFSGAVHGSSVVIGGLGVLIRGQSGAGKSDLALRLIDRGAVLLADDYTHIVRAGGAVIGSAPGTITGEMEVRGLGILPFPAAPHAPIVLIVTLLGDSDPMPERLPETMPTQRLCDMELPLLSLHGREASAPVKIELALRHWCGQTGMREPTQ